MTKKKSKDPQKNSNGSLPSNSSILSGKYKKMKSYNSDSDSLHIKSPRHQPAPISTICGCKRSNFIIIFSLLVVIGVTVFYHDNVTKYISPIAMRYVPENLGHIDFTPWTLKSVVGARMFEKGYRAKFPVIGIPGYITTALELWKGKPCMGNLFRTKIWGGTQMLSQIASDMNCWLEHIKLGPDGADPEGIKVRSLRGLESVDYVLPGYWVWARIILELGEIGYDANNLSVESYDWRLGFDQLEKRDGYFSKLKKNIEFQVNFHHTKVVIVSHSLGSLVWYYFMKWVEDKHHGKGGPHWVDTHIEHFVNIGGPMLGVAKAATALVSGEMRDTAAFLMQNLLGDPSTTCYQREDPNSGEP
jgi:hypothetical protein